MFNHKFKRGDRVDTGSKGVGTIQICYMKGDDHMYVVRLMSGIEHDYSESDLKFYYPNSYKKQPSRGDIGTNCPVCRTEWTRTKFGVKEWYDCLKCGKKAEDLVSRSTSTYDTTNTDFWDELDTLFGNKKSNDEDDDDDWGVIF